VESKLRVVLDTNVLISALTHSGVTRDFVYKLLERKIEIILSDYILIEAKEVLRRNKFKDRSLSNSLWATVKGGSEIVKVKFKITKAQLRDPADHPILLTAKRGKASIIITGDGDLLVLKEWNKIKILTMKEFKSL